MNTDQLRSNGYSNGHHAQIERQPKRVDYPRLLALGRELLIAIGVSTDQMVVVPGMRVWSICQHHLLPIWADISIGDIATDRILGLYKFARITQKYAHQLQLQERLYKEIADEIVMLAKSTDVAILAQEQHFCMTARGIKTPAIMTCSIMHGVFRERHEARMEFLRLTERSHI